MKNVYLQNFRKSKELSTDDLAKALGISPSLYEKVEYGVRNPSFGFVCKLRKAFPDVDIEMLIQGATQDTIAPATRERKCKSWKKNYN